MGEFDALSILDDVKKIALESGEIIREADSRPRQIRHKGRIDLVTETDVAVEDFLKAELGQLLPESDFLAEESAKHTKPGELTWIIDPVDGTTNFAHGLPFVATSIGLWHRDRIVLGIINIPLMEELFSAVSGKGAQLNENPIKVTDVSDLESSLLATGFPYAIEEHLESVIGPLRKLLPLTQGIRRPGAAALDLAYVACGRYEGFYELALNPWDTAAGLLLVEEAGGRVTEYDAYTPYTLGAPSILATNGGIHDELSGILCSV